MVLGIQQFAQNGEARNGVQSVPFVLQYRPFVRILLLYCSLFTRTEYPTIPLIITVFLFLFLFFVLLMILV